MVKSELIIGYVVRNKDNSLDLHPIEPYKDIDRGHWDSSECSMQLEEQMFPDVHWEDKYPLRVLITFNPI